MDAQINSHSMLRVQQGYTLAIVLGLFTVLTLLGTIAFQNTRTDMVYTARTKKNMRAALVAESAVNWALSELRRTRGDWVPYSKATHDPSGTTALSDNVSGYVQGRKLRATEVFAIYPSGSPAVDGNGWIYQSTSNTSNSISGVVPEKMSFKVWYPPTPVNTVRIAARGISGTDTSIVEFIGNFNDTFIPQP
jgi:Tfp pilus assembly protein PilX